MSKYITIPPEKIKQWVIRNFPDYRERRDGAELVLCSPFDDDTGYNFNINPSRGVCHDWRGDEWTSINPRTGKRSTGFINFVKTYKRCSWQQACKEVLGTSTYLRFKPKPEKTVQDEVPDLVLPAGSVPIIDSPQPKMARMITNWLRSRGVNRQQISEYRMCHMASDVVWPYYEYDALVYWQTRSMLSKRFLFPTKEVADKDFFYGFDHAEPASYVIITEAIFGALMLGPQALASGGASMSDKQARKLTLLDPVDGVILAPDNDKPGIMSVLHNAPLVQGLKYKVFYSLPPKLKLGVDELGKDVFAKDWNDLVKIMPKSGILEYLLAGIKSFTPRTKLELY